MILGDQKSRDHERLPIVPDFVELLDSESSKSRRGNVFRFAGKTKSGRLSFEQVKKVIKALGKEAKVKVDSKKTATAHDFRRSFGSRWALEVMPQILQKLMRHKDIKTTMTFYAHLDSDRVIESLLGDRLGDRSAKKGDLKKSQK